MLAQYLLDELVHNPRKSRIDRLRYYVATKARRLLLRAVDPMVQFQVAGKTLRARFSHDLPINAAYHLHYNTNLSRIACCLKAKYPDLAIIDIGANIGDTVAYLRRDITAPILCIEGNADFVPFLKENIQSEKDVATEFAFVGSATGELKATVHTQRGTSRIELGASSGRSVVTKSLEQIVNDHAEFQAAKLIKIDTDGFDLPIIRGSLDFLQKNRPVLFFEYDPAYFLPLGDDGLSVFEALRNVGYAYALIYDNFGELLLSAQLDERRVIEDIHHYFTGRNSGRYCDICIFAKEDAQLGEEIRAKEQQFFRTQRTPPAP